MLADELGITITVNDLPPGTSKWNRIEHRLLAFITMNWRGKPLVSYLAIIQLIASTTTDTGLTVTCQLDANAYEKGIKVIDDEMPPSTSHPLLSTASGTTPSPRGGQTDDVVIRAQALTVEWLPKYTRELNDIEVVWHDLKVYNLAHQTLTGVAELDGAIHKAVDDLNRERAAVPLAKPRISA